MENLPEKIESDFDRVFITEDSFNKIVQWQSEPSTEDWQIQHRQNYVNLCIKDSNHWLDSLFVSAQGVREFIDDIPLTKSQRIRVDNLLESLKVIINTSTKKPF